MAEPGTAEYYRQRAAEVRHHAQTLEDGTNMRLMLGIAHTYDRLALSAALAAKRIEPSD